MQVSHHRVNFEVESFIPVTWRWKLPHIRILPRFIYQVPLYFPYEENRSRTTDAVDWDIFTSHLDRIALFTRSRWKYCHLVTVRHHQNDRPEHRIRRPRSSIYDVPVERKCTSETGEANEPLDTLRPHPIREYSCLPGRIMHPASWFLI